METWIKSSSGSFLQGRKSEKQNFSVKTEVKPAHPTLEMEYFRRNIKFIFSKTEVWFGKTFTAHEQNEIC